MPSTEPLDLVIPSTENCIVIPSIELLNLVIPFAKELHCDSFHKGLHCDSGQIHCDSFYRGLRCDSLYTGSCTGSGIDNSSTKDCIVIRSIESYM